MPVHLPIARCHARMLRTQVCIAAALSSQSRRSSEGGRGVNALTATDDVWNGSCSVMSEVPTTSLSGE